jgi:voltage-gated potassium channel
MTEARSKHGHVSAYELLLVALSLYVLVALFVERVFHLSTQTLEILVFIDTVICGVFLADFAVQFLTAPSKFYYLRWGWIDLLSSIPALPFFRWGRLVRVIRVIRLLRGIRAAKILGTVIFSHRAKGALATALFLCIVMVTFGSVTILHVETDPESNIRTAGDALWWSLATVATVGYGDKCPVTAEGRALGILLMIAGIGLFGTFTGYLATWFMEPPTGDDSLSQVRDELASLRFELREFRLNVTAEVSSVSSPKAQATGVGESPAD